MDGAYRTKDIRTEMRTQFRSENQKGKTTWET